MLSPEPLQVAAAFLGLWVIRTVELLPADFDRLGDLMGKTAERCSNLA